MRAVLGGLFLGLTALTLLAVPPLAVEAQGNVLRVLPTSPRQGDALVVRVTDPSVTEARASWRGRNLNLYRQQDGWGVLFPIEPETKVGGHTLTVNLSRGGTREQIKRVVKVAAVKFRVQRLGMPGKISRLYNYPGVEREEAALSAAIRTRSPERLWQGDWTLPARGRLSTPFGVRRIRNGRGVGRHRGLDIAAPTGTPVLAPAAGRVVLAKPNRQFKKYGNTVVLDHGQGLTSMYIHMSAITAKVGDVLQPGDQLGKIGSTGVSTGPHLHWSVYVQGRSIEPWFFCRLSKRGVALGR
jgi:murein DD-endopeptidase MepM/ murein hydrolase activator NlpD